MSAKHSSASVPLARIKDPNNERPKDLRARSKIATINPAQVVVIGSLNIDLLAQVECLPQPGQTVSASALVRRFGGKGANKALAVARQGVDVALIGCLGDDADGREYRASLERSGVETSGVTTARRQLTGTAMIAVSKEGENFIVVNAAANAAVTTRHVRLHREVIANAAVVLLQWEIPLPPITEVMMIANRARVPVIFNPAPMHPDFPWGKVRIAILIVNESEARNLFGRRALNGTNAFWQAQLTAHGADRILITRGARSTIYVARDGRREVPVLALTPVDTVGAGDIFVGVLAARLAEGAEFIDAVTAANCAGGLATLQPGAQEAIPSRRATDQAVRRLRPQQCLNITHILKTAPASDRRVRHSH